MIENSLRKWHKLFDTIKRLGLSDSDSDFYLTTAR